MHALVTTGRLFAIPAAAGTDDGDRFMLDFGLERILDGLAAHIAGRRSGTAT
ncbi:hypothetical protein [Pseudonocardia sp. GCM10023141]|uniref:hypothetical protein n=1 Tax=Pseudonocardia sp. GCM10023141 TaxID=3252653 RepID=UPI003623137D